MRKAEKTLAALTILVTPLFSACGATSHTTSVTHTAHVSPHTQPSKTISNTSTLTPKHETPQPDENQTILTHDKYKSIINDDEDMKQLIGDPVWVTKNNLLFASNDVLVTQDDSKANGVSYYGYETKSGKQLWHNSFSQPQGVTGMNVTSSQILPLGNQFLIRWSGTIKSDDGVTPIPMTYVQSFDMTTGKKIEGIRENTQYARLNAVGAGYSLSNEDSEDAEQARVFYPNGLAVDDISDKALKDKLFASDQQTLHTVIHTAAGEGFIVYSSMTNGSEMFYIQAFTGGGYLMNQPMPCTIGEVSQSNSPVLSPGGKKMLFGNAVIDMSDPTSMSCIDSAINKQEIDRATLDDNGNVLGVVSASEQPTWVYVPNGATQGKLLSAAKWGITPLALGLDYIALPVSVQYVDNSTLLWSGNGGIFKRKDLS